MKPSDPLNTRKPAGRCSSCGKYTYLTRKAARHAVRSVHHDSMRPYRCPEHPHLWHIGHNPGWVVRGEQPGSAA